MMRVEPEVGNLEFGCMEELHGLGDVQSEAEGLSQRDARRCLRPVRLALRSRDGLRWRVEEVEETAEGHELADEAETRRRVENGQHRQDVGVIEDAKARKLLLEVPSLQPKRGGGSS